MGIGYREVMVLLGMLLVMVLTLAGIVWLIVWLIRTTSKPSKAITRSTAERLAELESLKKAEQITAAEYEKQRATIVASV
jgi:uncharacterized membrane protein